MIYKLSILLLLLMLAVPATAQDESDPEADAIAIAQGMIAELNAEDYEAVVERFTPEMSAALPVGTLDQTWTSLTEQFGMYESEYAVTVEPAPGTDGLTVTVTTIFENAPLDFIVTVLPDGQIAGLFIRPASVQLDAVAYIDPDAFTETDVIVGEDGEWPLPGTLALPNGDGPFPAVILLGGSGPTDRDGTVGAQAPLRDIAQGLASQGIAVLRYDKRPLVHGAQLADVTDFTLQEEYVDDTLAAITLLQSTEGVDTENIYIAGHSLGGSAAPRIAAQSEDVAGLIILAGGAAPLSDTIVRQFTYIAGLDGDISEEEQAQIDAVTVDAEAINALAAGEDIEAPASLLGTPASYWLDLLTNPPAERAADLEIPMLILQGERDYQVTVADDLALWEAATAERDDVTITTYAELGHAFTTASDPATPDDYAVAANVDAAVIEDIIAWVNANSTE